MLKMERNAGSAAPYSGAKSKTIGYMDPKCKGTGLNLLMCVLCIVCVTASVYGGWREIVLERRVDFLEAEVALLKRRGIVPGEMMAMGDAVLLTRLRREAEERVQRGVLAGKAVLEAHRRTAREAPECICPAGRLFYFGFTLFLC